MKHKKNGVLVLVGGGGVATGGCEALERAGDSKDDSEKLFESSSC